MELNSVDDVRGRYWPELWPAESRDMVEASLSIARETGVATFNATRPTAKGTPKWWNVTLATMPGEAGDIIVVSRDMTAERDSRAAHDLVHERLMSIIGSNADMSWDIDLSTNDMWWGEGVMAALGYERDQIGGTTQWRNDHIHPDDRARVAAAMADAVESGAVIWEDDFRYRKADGDYVEVFDRGAIIRDIDGTALRFVGVMQDVTVRNAAGEAHKALAGEMMHRVNNVLAVVMGLFQQTASSSHSVSHLAETYANRLKAMAAANSAILRTAGRGASLASLASVQLGPFVGAGRLSAHGPDVVMPENLAQPIALALNELATNALKYGALSTAAGRVDLTWTVDGDDGALALSWIESGGPPVVEPGRSGVGSKLIERGIRHAKVERRFAPEGFSCAIVIPLDGR